MSTFAYENTPPVLRDSTVVRNFRINTPDEYLTRLNLDLGISLTVRDFLRIQVYFANTAYRDPTVGELRLLDAVAQRERCTADRIAVGELITESPALAETWADMMAKRSATADRALPSRDSKSPADPCTILEGLDLTGRYLYQTGIRPSEDTVIVSSPRGEAVASAEGYAPVARIKVGGGVRSLWKRREKILEDTPCRAGDMILYIPRMTLKGAQALVAAEADKRRPNVGAIRAIAHKSLLATILELCPAVDLHASRLPGFGQNGAEVPFSVLCGYPSVAADGACGYALRVPLRAMPEMTRVLQEQNISFVACGQARMDGNLAILLPDMNGLGEYAAISLAPGLLHTLSAPGQCAMRPSALTAAPPKTVCPPMSRLPSADRELSGLTPDGREAVALTAQDGRILTVPEASTLITALQTEIFSVSSAYSAAAEATAAAALALENEGASPQNIRLSVSMTVSHRDMLTDGPALAAVCGVYCAAARLTVPVEDSVVEVVPSPIPITMTVTAWARVTPAAAEADDRQWRPSGESVHKESPAYFLPVLRRVCEGSLLALSAALNRNRAAACALRPLAVNTTTDEETGIASYALHPDSLQKLLDELNRFAVPVISMNREDTRLLLSHPAVTEALRRRAEEGWSTLVLGEACSVFAEYGLLPAALADTRVIPVGGQTAAAVYAFPAEPATRIFRADAIAPASAEGMEARHLLELRLADGTVVPDGFISEDGSILGLLNGLDTTVLPRVQSLSFDLS